MLPLKKIVFLVSFGIDIPEGYAKVDGAMVTEDSAPEERANPPSGKGGGVIRGSVASTTSTNSLLESTSLHIASKEPPFEK